MLVEALDLVDFGIVLLDQHFRVSFVNRRFDEMWNIQPSGPTTTLNLRELLSAVAAAGRCDMPPADLHAYLDQQEAEVNAGPAQPALMELADGRRILFRCATCADGGRVLTYADISQELRREAADTVARLTAELRFNVEILEEQGAHLAALAEAAEESARKAEAARLRLEHEMAERHQLEKQLRRLATTDGLTGALTRAQFLASAQQEMEAAQRQGRELVVLMLDVDHFKAINDNYGHAGGDRALQHLVATLGAGLRQVDLLGRLGGEEFAILLADTPPSPARRVAERLRAGVAESPFAFNDLFIPMTISIGLAVQLATDRSIEQVISRADGALYRAKRSGRNRVITDRRLEPV